MAKVIKEVKFEQLLEIKETESENGKSKTTIQVAKWGDNAPTLEKRMYFLKDGDWMTGKACGFNLKDFKRILKHKDEIKEALSESEE